MYRLLGCLVVAASILAVSGCTTSVDHAVSPIPEVFTPVLADVIAPPIATPTTDGKVHLAYELRLTNVLSQTVVLNGLAISGDGQELLQLEAADLAARTMVIGGGLGESALGAGRGALVFVDVVVEPDAVPAELTHELTIAPEQAMPPVFDSPMTENVATVTVDKSEPVVIASPVEGSNWLDGNSCCDVTPHRTAVNPINGSYFAPERYAIDFVQLDAGGQIFDGPIDSMSSYEFVGANIRAVADGPIVAIVSDLPDQTPGAHPTGLTLGQYGGNHIVQDIGNGRFAFYAHLQPGNPLDLAFGQKLSKGEVLGYLGNSGNTDTPHLHFHIMDSPLPLASNGLPFRIEKMTLTGTVSEEQLQSCMVAPLPCVSDTADAGERNKLSPLYRDVLDFPEG